MKTLCAIILLLAAGGLAPAAEYYVDGKGGDGLAEGGNDGHSGTLQAPWLTLVHATRQLKPGDTLYIRGGAYAEYPKDTIPSGTPEARVTVSNYKDEVVIIRPAEGRSQDSVLSIKGKCYINLRGLVLDGANKITQHTFVIWGDAPHHIRVENSTMMNGANSGICSNANNSEFINLKVHHNGKTSLHHGIYAGTDNNLIDGCEFSHNRGFGIHIYTSAPNSADNNVIRNCYSHHNGLAGAIIGVGEGNVATNNVFAHNGSTGIQVRGAGTEILNNTIYGHKLGLDVRNTKNVEIKANIIVGQNSGIAEFREQKAEQGDKGAERGGQRTGRGGAPGGRAAAAAATNIDPVVSNNFVEGDLMFVDAEKGDFRLKEGSPARGFGAVLAAARAGNFTSGTQAARKFGVHEIVLTGNGSVSNPFDTVVTVRFTPPSGAANAKNVWAVYDGENIWRARVYASEAGEWTWSSTCDTDLGLTGKSGTFRCHESELRGRLLPHPKNSRQWITEDGRWFLNLSDTAYFLLCAHDGNGDPVSDEQAKQYVRDDVSRGVTSLRCFLASRRGGFAESQEQWNAWHFETNSLDRLRLETVQCADRRMQMLLNDFPDVAVQLIMFPLEAYGRDDRFWAALSARHRERLLRNLVARFAAFPQLFWLITNDAHYGGKFPNSNAMVREVGAYLQQHDPWRHPRSTGHARRLPFYFGAEDWATYVHIEHEHDLGALEYAKYHEFTKPVFLGEDRYEQDHGPSRDPQHMRYWQRRLFWAWLLSGGSTNYGGRWWAVHPYTESGTRPATYHKRPNHTFRTRLAGLDSVRFIRDYFEHRPIDLGDFEPDHALASDLDGATGVRAPKLMRRGSEEFLIYHPHAADDEQAAHVNTARAARLRVDLRAATGRFAVEWCRAEDGETKDGGEVSAGRWQELTAPWSGADVIVRLRRK